MEVLNPISTPAASSLQEDNLPNVGFYDSLFSDLMDTEPNRVKEACWATFSDEHH